MENRRWRMSGHLPGTSLEQSPAPWCYCCHISKVNTLKGILEKWTWIHYKVINKCKIIDNLGKKDKEKMLKWSIYWAIHKILFTGHRKAKFFPLFIEKKMIYLYFWLIKMTFKNQNKGDMIFGFHLKFNFKCSNSFSFSK